MDHKMMDEKHEAVLSLPAPLAQRNQKKGILSRSRVRNAIILSATFSCWALYRYADAALSPGPHSACVGSSRGWVPSVQDKVPRGVEAETIFLEVPNAKSAIQTSRDFASVPHLAGSTEDFEQSKAMLRIFQTELNISASEKVPIYDAGSEESRHATLSITNLTEPQAWIDTYYPILNTPLVRELQIIGGNGAVAWNADVEEVGDDRDPAGKYAKTIGAWHGLSCSGDVTGPVVYVNYGRKEDFDELKAKGVDLGGKIAIARYGGVFRGLKVKAAQEAGAIGTLIYSDPRDDGTVTPAYGYQPYPAGPARNPNSIQRGSVQFLSKYPGDPSTPGYPSYPNVTRQDSLNIPSIPSLPISWINAQQILKEIDPDFNYELTGAPSKRSIRLSNQVDTKVTPVWNTMAVIPGHVKSEVVILGNHRDAWVLGAADPISGTAAMVEIVKAFGVLMKKGWRPLRTIVIASWDAEEPGLIGSTEYGEDFESFIREHVVAYINVDIGGGGSRYRLGGSPTLAHLMRDTAMQIAHPTDANRTLLDATRDVGKLTGPAPNATSLSFESMGIDWQNEELLMQKFKEPENTHILPLGSGSDYTVFLQRIGVASADFGWTGTHSDPVYHYHSVYDSHMWQELYGDPGFPRHVAIAKHLGLVALRLIDTPLLPLNTTQYALEIGTYLTKVQDLASLHAVDIDFSHLQKAIHMLQKTSEHLDNKKAHAAHRLQKALEDLERHHRSHRTRGDHVGRRYQRGWRKTRTFIKRVFGVKSQNPSSHGQEIKMSLADGIEAYQRGHQGSGHLPGPIRRVMKAAQEVVAINKKLSSFEAGFIHKDGIKDREWYRNLVVAPGKWTGYGATTLPALSEAIEVEKNATLAQHEAKRMTDLLHHLSKTIHA